MAKKVVKRYLFPADYMADPSVHVFNGKIYIYPSHDWEDDSNVEDDSGDQYIMKDYHVLSIEGDPMNGKVVDHGCVLRQEDIAWHGRQLWDCDVQEKDGKYYMFFPMKDKNEVFRHGVAVADNPAGPFIPQPEPVHGSYSIDMAILKDDDGEYYMYFGGLWGGQLQSYRDNVGIEDPAKNNTPDSPNLPHGDQPSLPSRVVKLSKDMLQFGEEPKPVQVVGEDGKPLAADDPHRFFEASWTFKKDGKYYFTYSTGDSHLLCYAVGDNVYGPFTYKGVILTPVVGWTTHHAIIEWEGKWYLFHHDSAPSGGKSWLRSLKVCELTFNEDGTIETIEGIDE